VVGTVGAAIDPVVVPVVSGAQAPIVSPWRAWAGHALALIVIVTCGFVRECVL